MIERAVRIARISLSECTILDCEEPPAETAQTWLKLPGREPIRIVATPSATGELTCAFVQSLHPTELQAVLAHRPAQVQPHQRHQPRCTLLD